MIYNAIHATQTHALLTTALDLQNPFAYFDGLIWLEFTGAKDKDNVDVYEGDVLDHDGSKFAISYSENKRCLVAIYFSNKDLEIPIGEVPFDTCKVEGNIFELNTDNK